MLADMIGGRNLIPYTLYTNGISKKNSTTRSYLPWKGKRLTTSSLLQQKYKGDGTEKSPYIINWLDDDPENPMTWKSAYKWFVTIFVGIATFAVTFVSSAYTGGFGQILTELHTSPEVATLGLSLFVLGFAVGPLLWAPLSEVLGRRILFILTYGILTAFNAGAAGSQNIWTLVILRFFAGAFGSSPLTNAGGTLADMFEASQRGLAMAVFAAAPFLGPGAGPIVGGFVGETVGWRWVEGVMAIFTGVVWIVGIFFLPETYSPVLLRERANKLSKITGRVYRSKYEETKVTKLSELFKTALSRPWLLLFREPIVFLLSLYMAIIYGTLYMLFGAFPIVYQEERGWSEGIGGCAFLGVLVGMLLAVVYMIPENTRYNKKAKESEDGRASPEARLPPGMVGSIAIPVGMFWFAWTNYPSIHWIVSIAAGAPFGFGMVLIFLSIMNYLVDAYTIYAASVLAANSVLRSIFGAAFPLFTTQMYHNLGIHWASCIPAFLALACVPFPFLFYRFGAQIRKKCKYAAEAEKLMQSAGAKPKINSGGNTTKPTKQKKDLKPIVLV
jgi:multidrug resistance protein